MQATLKNVRLAAAAVAATFLLAGALPGMAAFAQTTPPAASTAAVLSEPVIKSLQEALNKQGFATKTDGILSDETRAAIRKYQTQHHLPVTGEPDKATLDKLGVAARQSATPDGQTAQGQAAATTGAGNPTMGPQMMQGGMMQGGMMPGGMMNCPMMSGQAQSGPSGMQGPMPMQPGQMPQGGASNGQMMQGMMQMMQMMQGMMQMMHAQMQREQAPSGQTAPMQQGPTPQGPMQPGQMQPGKPAR